MRICVISNNYPTKDNQKHVYLKNLVDELVDLGNECFVIAPQSGKRKRDYVMSCLSKKGHEYLVYSPKYTHFSGRKIGPINLGVLTQKSFRKAVLKVYEKEKLISDALYAQFIHAAVTASFLSKKYNIPFYFDNGESNLQVFIDTLSKKEVKEMFDSVRMIFSVSTANKNEIFDSDLFNHNREEIVHIVPNGVDPEKFYKIDKTTVRKELGINNDAFITIFVGQFVHRKGPTRVCQALEMCEDVYSIFIGSGREEFNYEKCLFKGRVDNKEIVKYLNASDVFVLPTLNEGCCNAIIEALACGVPVVSSNLDFNYDILDKECAFLVNPENIQEISDAIKALQSSPQLLTQMSHHALEKSRELTIRKRAERIFLLMLSK